MKEFKYFWLRQNKYFKIKVKYIVLFLMADNESIKIDIFESIVNVKI